LFSAVLGLTSPAAYGRGLVHEDAPWYLPDLADSTLQLGFAATYVPAPRAAAVFQTALAPWRKGPVRLGATWSFVSVRGPTGEASGFGDPKFFARLRLAGSDWTVARLFIEGAARLPTASAKLYPYAFGGQELELWGVVGFGAPPLELLLGGGGSWTEPSTGLTPADVPHATRAWAQLARRTAHWGARVRCDFDRFDGGAYRTGICAGVTHFATDAIRATVAGGVEIGPRRDRAAESFVQLRFAVPLR